MENAKKALEKSVMIVCIQRGRAEMTSGRREDRALAYSFLSRFRIKPEREPDFVRLAKQMEGLVDREPGTLAFKFFRLSDPNMFAVYESFVDEAADRAHMETPHGKPLIEEMIGCMDGSYSREMLLDLEPEA
jgi:autoinducer 2-degrading protein